MTLSTRLFSALALCFSPLLSIATPQVNNNTISWPNDGWYEVQRNSDQTSVCQGGSSCKVNPGKYIVINHTLQQRFENLVVSETSENTTQSHTEVTVSGNQIHLPNDGWYQVQSSKNYATICEGTRSCLVAPGVYNVINLSTGVRLDNLQVPSASIPNTPASTPTNTPASTPTSTPVSAVSVNGNKVSWPDDGWYQVQNAQNYQTLCEGGRECELGNGVYTVINLTTGLRTENVVAASTTNGSESGQQIPALPWDARMLFLQSLGQPPYANLPVLDYQTSSQDIRYSSNETLPAALNDCLLERLGLFYCYKADNRTLLSLLGTGEPHWSFTLPGDNQTNRIDGMALVNYSQLALVANVTTEFGYPKHEVSYFSANGAFQQTNNIFQLNGATWPTINLQGEPLTVIRGTVTNDQHWPFTVTGNYYELAAGGNRANPADWAQAGAVEAVIDPRNSTYQSIRMCDAARVSFDGGVGMELCEGSAYEPLLTQNNSQIRLRASVEQLTSNTLKITADFLPIAKQAARASGLVTDLPCQNALNDSACLTALLPNVGNRITSATTTIECPSLSWNNNEFRYTNGTAQLQQSLVRISNNQVRLEDAFTFTERCAFPELPGDLTGSATLRSNISLLDGSVTDTDTEFEDLAVVVGGNYRRFIEATYRDTSDASTASFTINAAQIDFGAICNRSCAPYVIISGYYTDINLSAETLNDGTERYQYDTAYIAANTLEADPGVQRQMLRASLEYAPGSSSPSNIGPSNSYAELVDSDGSQIRVAPVFNNTYPSIPFVSYEFTGSDLSVKTWQLPARSFIRGDIIRLEAL